MIRASSIACPWRTHWCSMDGPWIGHIDPWTVHERSVDGTILKRRTHATVSFFSMLCLGASISCERNRRFKHFRILWAFVRFNLNQLCKRLGLLLPSVFPGFARKGEDGTKRGTIRLSQEELWDPSISCFSQTRCRNKSNSVNAPSSAPFEGLHEVSLV